MQMHSALYGTSTSTTAINHAWIMHTVMCIFRIECRGAFVLCEIVGALTLCIGNLHR